MSVGHLGYLSGQRNRVGRILSSMRRFSQVIELELKDLPLQGGPYTRKGGLNSQRMARLDKFLVADAWEVLFGGARQSLLPKPLSELHPILLEGGGCPVRVHYRAHYPLGLRTCGSFGRLEVKKEALKKVKEWDDLDVQRPLSVREREQKLETLKEFKRWALLEEISWRQKSREIWLNEGNRNIGFFHRMMNSHRRGNQISKMRITKHGLLRKKSWDRVLWKPSKLCYQTQGSGEQA